MRPPVFRTLAFALGFVVWCGVAHAQWSSDPSNNLVLADNSNEQVQAKLAPTADGGFYVSWFDNSSGGYDVYLQRLDVAGNEQWPHNGILIANRDLSSTEDYGLDIDSDGNALLAFGFTVAGVLQVEAQKVAPDGTLLWGASGVIVSADPDGTDSPKIAALADGSVAVSWSNESDGSVVVQKLDGDGNPLWGTGITVTDGATLYAVGDLHGDPDGNVIASWIVLSFSSPHAMYAQKLATDGGPLWGTSGVTIEDATDGALQFGNFPPFVSDGAGGAVFVWYTVGSSIGEVHAQHVMSDGSQAFAQNGVLASSNTTRNHFEPSGAYDAASGDIYALWRETDASTQTHIGVYAQRIDSSGARQWTDNGLVLVPLALLDQTEMLALPVAGGGLYAAWASNDAPNPMPIHVARLDTSGNYVWSGNTVDITTESNDIERVAGALSTTGYAAYAWTANAASFAGDIHAQNINPDGTLGIEILDRIFADGFDGP